jgi:hypothetical protein
MSSPISIVDVNHRFGAQRAPAADAKDAALWRAVGEK